MKSQDLLTWRRTVLTAVLSHAFHDTLITPECHFMMDFTLNCDFLTPDEITLLNSKLLEGTLALFSHYCR